MRRIYFDSNILIYLAEYPPIFGPIAEAFLAEALRSGHQIVTSDLAVAEWVYGATKHGRSDVADYYRQVIAETSQFQCVRVSAAAFELASVFGPRLGLKLLDAVHIFVAIENGCATFVTNDLSFARVVDIQIINPFKDIRPIP
jgi:predicted nucleic acid-binding protein